MLQKILVVLFGFVVTVVGALAPSGLFAQTSIEGDLQLKAGFSEQTVSTVDGGGQAFARVNVLWIEVDGLRVSEDAWGTGSIKELRFKVGVKDVDGKQLVLGDKTIDLHPTDVVTVRMFQGDFAYRDMGTTGATLQIQGNVKTTLVKEGDVGTKVRTELGEAAGGATQASGGDRDGALAYVVLETGARLDTLAVEDGGSRIFTEEAVTAAQATNEPGNLLAKWVKMDGQLVREYTWGDGAVGRIEFEPAESSARSVVVAFNGQASEALAGQRVVVADFVGEYTIYQVSGGLARLRLDGYAKTYSVGEENVVPLPLGGSGDGAPRADFTWFPPNPRTTDTIQFFSSSSSDDDGIIVFTVWKFDEQGASVLPEPSHRFRKPGTYNVTLTVTDDDLQTDEVTLPITVRNADPVPDFDFSPKIVSTGALVTFTDRSVDTDGALAAWRWDFGEGNVSTQPNPTHRFQRPGNATVTLSVTDDLGATATVSKIIIVRNALPTPAFRWTHDNAPLDPASKVPVRFFDESTDPDGEVSDWRWNFGDGNVGTGKNVTHSFERPGTYTVTLTAYDDKGDRASTSQKVTVRNRPAVVDFAYSPDAPSANMPVGFRSSAYDPDGVVLHQEWRFDDGTQTPGGSTTHSFPRAGSYWVNLTAIDSSGESSWINKTITIENTAPKPRFGASPSPATRVEPVSFLDLSVDPDGDTITAWRWDFGDGNTSTLRNPVHQYERLGTYTVRLNVTDSNGRSDETSAPLVVLNARPMIQNFSIEPGTTRSGVVNETITFNANATDADRRPGDNLEYTWRIVGGPVLVGKNAQHAFASPGTYVATLFVKDVEGGESATPSRSFVIEIAPPLASFALTPAAPSTDEDVVFTDLSASTNGPITGWNWDFGDGSSSTQRNPVHRYAEHGARTVHLTVTDSAGRQNTTSRGLYVNGVPMSLFEKDRSGSLPRGTQVTFTDRSSDPEMDLREWTWSFGEGAPVTYTTSTYDASPRYTYTQPGPKTVTLTVKDGQGATHTSVQTLRIDNQAPRASFTYSPTPPKVGDVIDFISTSSDPDGTTLTSHSWTFGDQQSATGATTTHSYGASGNYLVSHQVSDGELLSPSTQDSFRLVRVGAADPLTVRFQVKYPGDRTVDLSDANVTASIRLTAGGGNLRTIAESSLVPNGGWYEYVFGPGEWARGDSVLISVQNATFQAAPQTFPYNVKSDGETLIQHTFHLAMPVKPTVEVQPGDDGLIPLLEAERTEDGTPIYRQPFDDVRGNGTLVYRDGFPATSATVHIEMRYLPLSALSAVGAGNEFLDSFRGWCQVATTQSDAFGRYTFSTHEVLCQNDDLPLPPGVYEIRAAPSVQHARNEMSDVARFIVDPTGLAVPLVEKLTD